MNLATAMHGHAVIVAGLIFLMRESPQQTRDDDSQKQ